MLGRVPEGVRSTALFCLKQHLLAQRGKYRNNTGRMLTGARIDDRYVRIELDLVHVKNALQTLSKYRDEFPLGTAIRDPSYWRARLESIRVMADRYNYQDLQARSDDLLVEVTKLQFWTTRHRDTEVGSVSASGGSVRPRRNMSTEDEHDTCRPLVAHCRSTLPPK